MMMLSSNSTWIGVGALVFVILVVCVFGACMATTRRVPNAAPLVTHLRPKPIMTTVPSSASCNLCRFNCSWKTEASAQVWSVPGGVPLVPIPLYSISVVKFALSRTGNVVTLQSPGFSVPISHGLTGFGQIFYTLKHRIPKQFYALYGTHSRFVCCTSPVVGLTTSDTPTADDRADGTVASTWILDNPTSSTGEGIFTIIGRDHISSTAYTYVATGSVPGVKLVVMPWSVSWIAKYT